MSGVVNRLLSPDEISDLLSRLDGWQLKDGQISKSYPFKNYYQTMAFVNAVAWISHREDHHPDMTVSYNTCRINYSTHDVRGLSVKDFNCATQADALFTP